MPAVAIVVRYGEIFLKGQNRPFFQAKLETNVRRALLGIDPSRVERMHGRMLAWVPEEKLGLALDRLARVFGVTSLSPARVVAPNLEALTDEAVRLATECARDSRTFKVATRRPDKAFPFRSIEVNRYVGAAVAQKLGLAVDLEAPQLEVGIEIGRERTFVYAETLPGPGGLPVGSSGKASLLLSGGIDSPVAGWLAMKRGLQVSAIYFHSFPYTGDKTKEKVIDLVRILTSWQGELPLFVVHFTEAQKALRDAGPAELAVVLYRRMMLRASARIAQREGALALITGENLGQVASQTLENLAVIEEASALPVLRPLLCNDKVETIALARRIGTFEPSVQPYEDCCSLFVPRHPATRARLSDVRAAEAKLDVEAMAVELAQTAERLLER